jgi:predicted metal-binding transcription factor (methanogenesis marker protein 9)
MELQANGISHDEYMTLKKQLADEILKNSNVNKTEYTDADIQSLADTFNISFDEAKSELEASGNDLKTTIRNLRMKTL